MPVGILRLDLDQPVVADEKITDKASDEDSDPEEVAPFGDAQDHYKTDRMAGPEAGAEFAIRNDIPGLAVFAGGWNCLTVGIATERGVGFHGDLLLSLTDPGGEEIEERPHKGGQKSTGSPEC